MAIIRNILVRVGADINPMQKNMAKAQNVLGSFNAQQKKALYSMNANMKTLMAGAGAGAAGVSGTMVVAKTAAVALAAAAAAAFAVVSVKGVKSAMEYESSMQQVNRIMGANAAGFVQWANTQASAYNMSRLEAVKYGAVYGNLMSSITSSQAKAADYTTQLLKASAVVASATGRDMTDVMERIRSGLLGNTEAIEDLGINVNVAMLQSTETFKKFANGKSWDQLDFRTQQQIRLFAILEQSTSKFGTDVYKNTASGLTQFTSLLKDAQLNLGQAFLPIVQVVTPVLISFAQNIKYVTSVFAQFMQALFGTNSQQAQNAKAASQAAAAQTKLGKATKAAGAAAKGSIAGFDEINQLQESLAGNAADAAGAMGDTATSMPTAAQGDTGTSLIPQGVLDFANKVREALQPIGGYFAELGGYFKTFWANIQPALQPIIDFIVRVFTPVWQGMVAIIGVVFNTIKGMIQGALQIIQGVIEVFSGLLTGNWSMLWQGIKDILSGAWTIVKVVFEGAIKIIEIAWASFTQVLFVVWETVWSAISSFASTAWEALKNLAISVWTIIATFLSTTWEGIRISAVTKWTAISTFFSTTWMGIRNGAITAWDNIKTSLSGTWDWLSTRASEVFSNIKNSIITAFSTVKDAIWNIWDGIKNSIKNSINFIVETINSFIRRINSISISIPAVIVAGVTLFDGASLSFPHIPEIPQLAKGGIIGSPTLAMIGEAGKEAVVPLEDTSFVDTLASAIGTAVLNAMQFSQQPGNQFQQGQAVFNLDGSQFARAIIPLINKEQSRQGPMAIQGV